MNSFNLENQPRLKPGFTTPDDYFDGLEDQVLARLPERGAKVVPLFQRHRAAIYAVAAVLVLALLIPLLNRLWHPAEIDDATIENYLAYQSGINQFDLLTVLEPQDIEKLKVDMPVADEAIEDFLLTSDIEHSITE